jgi:outer membrane receptor for ferrienterochelin and colicins
MDMKHAIILSLAFAGLSFGADASPQDSQSPAEVVGMDLDQLMDIEVVSASLHRQGIGDAPANVSVIKAVDIRRFGYRTLAEALNSVPGLYVTTDRSYAYLGSRGLSTPGDFGTRYLLMVNGHPIADPVYDLSGTLEQEFGIEMSLIDQIEIVHGPGSALYGSNAVLCTINVLTKKPAEMSGMQVETTLGTAGEKKAHLAAAGSWKHMTGVFSASAFNFGGEHSIYISERDTPENNLGPAINMDGQRGFHLFANVTWRAWNFTFMEGERDKIVPVSWGGSTVFNDRGTRLLDRHGFAEATYQHSWARSDLEWRLSYDWYDYVAHYRYATTDSAGASVVEDNRDDDPSKWLGSRLVYRVQLGRAGTTTVGADTRIDLQSLQMNFDLSPEFVSFVHIDKPDRRFGVFAQHEMDLSRRWKVVMGARLDTSAYRRDSLSPRLALIWAKSSKTAIKLLYGRSFRNPNSYEMFYYDSFGADSNPGLKPEIADTFELVAERQMRRRFRTSIDLFSTRMRNLITLGTNDAGDVQFNNQGAERLIGATAQVAGKPISLLEFDASLTIQDASNIDTGAALANSPHQLAKFRASVPLFDRRFLLSGITYWMGRRNTLPGTSVSGAWKSDLTLTTTGLKHGLNLQFGIRNLCNQRSLDPAGLDPLVAAMPQIGRTAFVSMTWHIKE